MGGTEHPHGVFLADKERGDYELEFVGECLLQELSMDLPAAFDHEPLDAVDVTEDIKGHRPGVAGWDTLDGGEATESLTSLLCCLAADSEDELLSP